MNDKENEKWFVEFKDKLDKINQKLTTIERVKEGGFLIKQKPHTLEIFKENFNIGDELESDCCKSGLKGLYLKEFGLHCLFCDKCNILKYVILRKWLMEIKLKPPK